MKADRHAGLARVLELVHRVMGLCHFELAQKQMNISQHKRRSGCPTLGVSFGRKLCCSRRCIIGVGRSCNL
jgi:hypothetical protein